MTSAREVEAALEHASSTALWCDDVRRPGPRPALGGDHDVDPAVVGGGFTGLWAALLALEEDPGRDVVVLEGARLGWAATGRNGGFCSSSLTHGVGNGLARWPQEMPLLQRLGAANLDAIEATIGDRGIDCDFERTGELDVALEAWQLDDLRDLHHRLRDLGQEVDLLSAAQTRALVCSPTYLGGCWTAMAWRCSTRPGWPGVWRTPSRAPGAGSTRPPGCFGCVRPQSTSR
jgi:glycine/D-amino acid oxidase-like deaminating enzyme